MAESRSGETGGMEVRTGQAHEMVTAAAALVRETAPEPVRDALMAFVSMVFEGADEGDLGQYDAAGLAGIAAALWAFTEIRQPGEPIVRVFNAEESTYPFETPNTVIQINTDDSRFIIDSVVDELTAHGFQVVRLIHPILEVQRDRGGRRVAVERAAKGGRGTGRALSPDNGMVRESVLHIEIDRQHSADVHREIEARLEEVLGLVRTVVGDWPAMTQAVDKAIRLMEHYAPAAVDREDLREAIAFLHWIQSDNFAFLGVRDYTIVGDVETGRLAPADTTGLGLLRDPSVRVLRRQGEMVVMTPEVREFLMQPVPIIVAKANRQSRVHRRVVMDYVGVKLYGRDGSVVGERRIVGLFTSSAYNRSPSDIPLLARKVALVIARAGLARDSHDERALRNILETYPRDELFQASVADLLDTSTGILRLQKRPQTRLFVRYDRFDRYASIIAYLPRDKYDTALRLKIADLLVRTFDGRIADFTPTFLQGPLIRVHFIIARDMGDIPRADVPALEAAIDGYTQNWADGVRSALLDRHGALAGRALIARYADGFSSAYRDHTTASAALDDIAVFEDLCGYPEIALRAYRKPGDPDTALRLKLYHWDVPVTLSDCMVVFENMGLRVIEETPYTVDVADGTGLTACGEEAGGRTIWMHDFFMAHRHARPIDLDAIDGAFEQAFRAVWFADAENDAFNRLVIDQGFGWRDVLILRALARFRKQAGSTFSDSYIVTALSAHDDIARLLVDLFKWRFDPDIASNDDIRTMRQGDLTTALEAALDDVTSLDADRIIRQMMALIMAAQRTNYFQRQADGQPKPYLSIKFASQELADLPDPKPLYEIFVYAPRFEGVHLRGGRVARGGIRWSDRAEDFRSEVLGLVKAQMVKNAVIVPVGAKGGFVPKHLPPPSAGRDAAVEEAIACYRLFISGLLDLTNNVLPDGTVMPVERVVCHDEPDPYLVVAADKGTATFSDIANDLAASYGFWLGDAFASGGRVGYDHKKMGITARGAWEAVKRHFRELGTNIQTTPFTVAGIGDMSGDVFGNGMLLSRHIRLIAAFDHRDIFIDPDPDPSISYEERARLFALPRTSWADYNPDLISAGGGVFSRSAKTIRITPQIQAALGITRTQMTPFELIRAILKARVDLLWFGGIGTYIKARGENHIEVADRANDGIRIDADEVRARVIGEGANLACTQRGRIEFARRGGRINTDFVDNAGGVDCSDHEVNIKIGLDAMVRAGALTPVDRDTLMAAMTDEVARLVLRSNYDQTLALTLAEISSPADLDAHGRFMRSLERAGDLIRSVEFLPDDEALREMKEAGLGLTRPAIAVLLAYSKIALFDDIADSSVPDDPHLMRDLFAYFPAVIGARFPDALHAHPLRREIIATLLANEVVNIGGLTFIHRIQDSMGVPAHDVARAFVITRDVFDVPALWERINALDTRVPALAQLFAYEAVRVFLRRQVLWFLRYRPADLNMSTAVGVYQDAVRALQGEIETLISPFQKAELDRRVEGAVAEGLDEALARAVAALEPLSSVCDIIDVARAQDWAPEDVAAVYFGMGAALNLDRLRSQGIDLALDEHWERLAVRRTIEDLYRQQRLLTNAIILHANGRPAAGRTGESVVALWLQDHAPEVARVTSLIEEMEASGPINGAKLSLAGSQIRDLLSGLSGRRPGEDMASGVR